MDGEEYESKMLEYYMEMGVISLEGMDENGEVIYSISEEAKELAPELWEAHVKYVDESLMALYEAGLVEIEYDENLEATIHLSKEAQKIAKEMGIVEIDFNDPPNN